MDDESERTGRKPENQHPRRRRREGVAAKLQSHILECWDGILALTLNGIVLSVLVSIGAVLVFRSTPLPFKSFPFIYNSIILRCRVQLLPALQNNPEAIVFLPRLLKVTWYL
jgi:hypothetical protein